MHQRNFAKILMACLAGLLLNGYSTASAEADDPISKLIRSISYEAENPALDIILASVSDCTLTVETLERVSDRSIISTSTTVSLSALHGNNSVFFVTPGQEDDGARFNFFVSEEAATATFRIDNPSKLSRRHFRQRFGQRCWGGDSCQIDYKPSALHFKIHSNTLAERQELRDSFRDAIDYCRSQDD